MLQLTQIQLFAVAALPILFAITLHEVAHGWVALKCGDKTAKMLGRLTVNPIKHIDVIGTIIVPAILLLLGGFIFGWAKPVPITWENFKNPRRDMALVAVAGPFANLLMALFWALWAKIGIALQVYMPMSGEGMLLMGKAGILFNLLLMLLNLLPIPPLDGSRIVSSVIRGRAAWYYSRTEPYGLFILLGLLATGILNMLLTQPLSITYAAITGLFGLN